MKTTNPKQLKIVYEFMPIDPAGEEKARQGLERGFDILFDVVFKAELEALESRKASRGEGVYLIQNHIVSNPAQLKT